MVYFVLFGTRRWVPREGNTSGLFSSFVMVPGLPSDTMSESKTEDSRGVCSCYREVDLLAVEQSTGVWLRVYLPSFL